MDVKKEPWEMTRDVFLKLAKVEELDSGKWRISYMAENGKIVTQTLVKKAGESSREALSRLHKMEVRDSGTPNKPVPTEVLKDYPDLAAKFNQSSKQEQEMDTVKEVKPARESSGERYRRALREYRYEKNPKNAKELGISFREVLRARSRSQQVSIFDTQAEFELDSGA